MRLLDILEQISKGFIFKITFSIFTNNINIDFKLIEITSLRSIIIFIISLELRTPYVLSLKGVMLSVYF